MRAYLFASLATVGMLLGSSAVMAQNPDRDDAKDEQGSSKVHNGTADKNMNRPHLGITVAPSNNTETEGVVVQQVMPNSPAAKAGLKRGDIITRVDQRDVTDAYDLVNVLAHHKAGDKLRFHIVRNDQERNLSVTLSPRTSEPTTHAAQQGEEETGQAQQQRMAFLGVQAVSTDEIPQRLRRRMGIAGEEGIVVLDVIPDSPAAKAGLQHGDVILSINNKELTNEADLRKLIQKTGVGSTVKMNVQRGDQTKKMTAKLGEAPWQFSMGEQPGLGLRNRFMERLPGARSGYFEDERQVERLERQVERLERRVRELEQRLNK